MKALLVVIVLFPLAGCITSGPDKGKISEAAYNTAKATVDQAVGLVTDLTYQLIDEIEDEVKQAEYRKRAAKVFMIVDAARRVMRIMIAPFVASGTEKP